MDPTRPARPKNWRRLKRASAVLFVVAVAMAAGGSAGSSWGIDPAVAYRLAALCAAGALVSGIVWAASAGMRDTSDDPER